MRDETLARLCADTIALLERDGIGAFDRFSRFGSRPLRHNGEPYRGGNAVALWATAELRGYQTPFWLTYKQAQAEGAHVRKGERGTTVLYVEPIPPREGDDDERGGWFARAYTVFNASQIDGLAPARYAPATRSQGFPDHQGCERWLDALGIERITGDRAAYAPPPRDVVMMPPREAFADSSAFYATLLHEAVHWSGSPGRCERPKGKTFGDPLYAMEELVAELGAALLCGDFAISKTPREDHAHYLASWLRALRQDPKALWSAASAAERATAWMKAQAAPAARAAA